MGKYDDLTDSQKRKKVEELKKKMSAEELTLLNANKHFYELKFTNKGGLVSPIIIQAKFVDGTEKTTYIPAEIWRKEEEKVSKVMIYEKEVQRFQIDPFLETADCDVDNNSWPASTQATRFQLFQQQRERENLMQRQKKVDELLKGK